MTTKQLILNLLVFLIPLGVTAQKSGNHRTEEILCSKLEEGGPFFPDYKQLGSFQLDSIRVIKQEKRIHLYFSPNVSYIPWREANIAAETMRLKTLVGRRFRKYSLSLYAGNRPLPEFIPNYYRQTIPVDSSHFPREKPEKLLFFRPNDLIGRHGLRGRHIAIWPSHGLYYESKLDRWEWQRARLHTTVEDLLPASYVLPYLAPMLEKAGAITFIPRERDWQLHEVIVDTDINQKGSACWLNKTEYHFETIRDQGFGWKDRYSGIDNPFQSGSYLIARRKAGNTDSSPERIALYTPDIPEKGFYAVYISYGTNSGASTQADYVIHSLNGADTIRVNQGMGAGTWIYLGHYFFGQGLDEGFGSVEVLKKEADGIVTLDAIKFGGGMGNIARGINRKDRPSGFPRFMEGARYYLQYAGMPDSIVWNLNNGQDDYKDDYQCRGEWVDYLMGNEAMGTGLGIPVDLALAFHTDAGISSVDSLIGTLAIYDDKAEGGIFPGGRSRSVNRELADLVQSQIVEDIRQVVRPDWPRRGLWNKAYSEAYRPDVPSVLLELHSHQNLSDMVYGLDPRFRFLVSRSIYKAILKFLAYQESRDFVVQPLPVDHLAIEHLGGKRVRLSWQAVPDPLEPSAMPEAFRVQMREDDDGFRVYRTIRNTRHLDIELPSYGRVYSFTVEAENAGGRSFPGEILSVGIPEVNDGTVLIVNGFDRISGPDVVDLGAFAGVASWSDPGVADREDRWTVGLPYEYDRQSPWLDDDNPGWGASHADLEKQVIPGNTFDFTQLHGRALMANGFAFTSISDEVFEDSLFTPKNICMIDVLFGEEKSTRSFGSGKPAFSLFTPGMLRQLKQSANEGIPLFLSGAYIGSDMHLLKDSLAIKAAREWLHFAWRSDHADRGGRIVGTAIPGIFPQADFWYNSGQVSNPYSVESPDAIEAYGDNAYTILRYENSQRSAAVAFAGKEHKTVVFGFPFESIVEERMRIECMKNLLSFLMSR